MIEISELQTVLGSHIWNIHFKHGTSWRLQDTGTPTQSSCWATIISSARAWNSRLLTSPQVYQIVSFPLTAKGCTLKVNLDTATLRHILETLKRKERTANFDLENKHLAWRVRDKYWRRMQERLTKRLCWCTCRLRRRIRNCHCHPLTWRSGQARPASICLACEHLMVLHLLRCSLWNLYAGPERLHQDWQRTFPTYKFDEIILRELVFEETNPSSSQLLERHSQKCRRFIVACAFHCDSNKGRFRIKALGSTKRGPSVNIS